MRSAYAEPMPLKWSIFLVAREKYESLSLFANIKTSFFLENAYPPAISPANKILLGLTTTNFQTRCYPNTECNKFSCFQFAESTSFRLRFSFVTKTFINIEYKMRIYYSICTEETQWFRKCMRVGCAPRAPSLSLSPSGTHLFVVHGLCSAKWRKDEIQVKKSSERKCIADVTEAMTATRISTKPIADKNIMVKQRTTLLSFSKNCHWVECTVHTHTCTHYNS